MDTAHDNAAYALLGRNLKNDWKVTKRVQASEFATGGNFSVCYLVSNGIDIGFLKALDIKKFITTLGEDILVAMNRVSSAFLYEKELLSMCREKRFSRVATILDEG